MENKAYNEAVEKLLPHIADVHSGDITEARKIISKVINALNIEIVSRESKLKLDDVVEYENSHGYVFHQLGECIDENIDSKDYDIIRRNTLPAVYVENMVNSKGGLKKV